jgi:hypothetical protein
MVSRYKKSLMSVLMAGTLVLGACGDDPTGLDDHAEPEGIVLRLNGQVLATYDGDTGQWSGNLTIGAGQETAHIDVEFVDHEGRALESDDDEYLDVVVGNGAIAEWEQDTPGEFGGHLKGKAPGQTTAVFKLMHGAVGSGHADFESPPATVVVN